MKTSTATSTATTSATSMSEPMKLLKKIGSTTYKVNVYFSNLSSEKFEDKILRLVEREVQKC